MKPTRMIRIGIFLAIALGLTQGSYAQQITYVRRYANRVPVYRAILFVSISLLWSGLTRAQIISAISPLNYTIRACAASPALDEVYVGDSSFFIMSIGNAWQNYHFFDRSVTLYAACFADDQYLAVGGTKGRIYYSTNDGGTWRVGTTGTKATIRGIATDGNGNFFAVGDSGLILESTDGGTSWPRLASPVSKQLNAIEFGPSGQYAVAVGNDSAIVVSTDDGATWNSEAMPYDLSSMGSELTHVDFSSLAMSPGEDSVWVGLEKPPLPLLLIKGKADPRQRFTVFPHSGPLTALIYTGDTGSGLYVKGFAPDDFEYYLSLNGDYTRGASPMIGDADGTIDTATNRIWCAAHESLPDGSGQAITAGDRLTIEVLTDADFAYLQNEPGHEWVSNYLDADVKDGVGWLIGTEGIIDRTNNGGFTRVERRAQGTFNSVCNLDGITGFIIGWNGLILRTEDSGKSWDTIPSGTHERLHGIAFPTPDTGIIVGDYGTMFRSTDRGFTWDPVQTPTNEYLHSVAFTTPGIGVAVGDSAALIRSTDGGNTWSNVNFVLTGTNTSIRRVQAFDGGIFLAQAGAILLRSSDYGQNWDIVNSPGDTIAMSFYSSRIGLVASRVTSSAIVPDTAFMFYTIDGGATWKPFVVPIWNQKRLVIYWLNDHQAMLNGINGFVVEVTISTSGVTLTPIAPTTNMQVYPNPATGQFHLDYSTKASGPVRIELWDEAGKKLRVLFSGEQEAGMHEQSFSLPSSVKGNLFIRLTADGTSSATKLTLQ